MFGVERQSAFSVIRACWGGRGCRDVGGGECAQLRDQVPGPSALPLTDRVAQTRRKGCHRAAIKVSLGPNRSGEFFSPTSSSACGSSGSCPQHKLGLRGPSGRNHTLLPGIFWRMTAAVSSPVPCPTRARHHPESLSLLLTMRDTALSLSWLH